MSIAKVKLIDLTTNLNNLDPILMSFIDLKGFHPVHASEIIEKVHGLTSFVTENPCEPLLTELDEIEQQFKIGLSDKENRDEKYKFSDMLEYMHEFRNRLETESNQIKELEKHIQVYNDALIQIENIMNLEIPLDDLFSCQYINIRFGRLPNSNVEKLRFFQNKPFIYKSFNHDHNNSWCMYFTTDEYKSEVDNMFSSLFFERIYIPDFVHGTPKDAEKSLNQEIENTTKMIEDYHQQLNNFIAESTEKLSAIKGELLFLNRVYDAKQYVVGLGNKFSISGFAEEKDVETFQKAFESFEDVEIEVNDAYSDRRIKPPTKLKNGWFSKPFSMFVEMYGLPSYGEIDPTPFVALTYSLLFGIMFGDFGQGLVLIILGYLLLKFKKMRLGAIGIRIGIFSALFGLLYGSFFGMEEVLTPLYTQVLGLSGNPVNVMDSSFTMTLLIAAISIGAFFIVIAMILNIFTLFKQKLYAELLVSHNGLAGLILYGYILVGAALQLVLGRSIFNIWTILGFAVVPLILIFLKEPLERAFHKENMFPKGFRGFFVEGFFELFEIILSYITNTMSFLRVGGFILSHAGMMLVVITLMFMVGNGGWVVLILGNIFVMGLEGMIVGIQVLRLEFYEMFSRYYHGNGIAFNALNK
ncbi:MAG: V-type ATP synthase subunit I [Firmicutes bacterium]|nr:V-type ATP synthase subunit I [Bacillota bacterium]